MIRSGVCGAAVLALVAGAGAAQAQAPVSLELRGGPAFATRDLGEAALKTGAGFEFSVAYRFLPHLGAYIGWDWHRLVTDGPFVNGEYDVEDTGYAFGLRFGHPLTQVVGGWFRAGGIYDHIELEDSDGDIVADSGHEPGWEVGAGLSFALTNGLSLTPGVRYRSFSTELEVGTVTVPVDLSYVTAEVGFTWQFGRPPVAASRTR